MTVERDVYFNSLPTPTGSSAGFNDKDKTALWEAAVPLDYAKTFEPKNVVNIIELHEAGVPAEYGRDLLAIGMWASTIVFLHNAHVLLEYAIDSYFHFGPSETVRLSQANIPLDYAVPLKELRRGSGVIIQLYQEGVPVEYAALLDSETGFELDFEGD